MRTIRRGVAGLALGLIAFAGFAEAAAAQETYRGQEVRVIDATRGLAVDDDQTMRIQIRNNLLPVGSVIVSVVSLTRPEVVLGAVLSNEAREYLIDTRLFPGGFQLIATGSQAGTQVSRKIDVAGQSRVKWNLATGLVKVERLADAESE